MTDRDIKKKRTTILQYVLVGAAILLFGIEYVESGDPSQIATAAFGAVFLLLSILRDAGDPAGTFKKWFSRGVLLIVILLTLVDVVGDLVMMLRWDIPIEGSDIRLWAGLVLVVIVGFVEWSLSRIEPAGGAHSMAGSPIDG